MHEMALCRGIVDIAVEHAERHAARRVTVVRVEVGALSCVEPAALEFCFAAIAGGTLAEGATLEIAVTPGEAWCWDCEAAFPATDRAAACPTCGGVRIRVTGGDQLRVMELEVT